MNSLKVPNLTLPHWQLKTCLLILLLTLGTGVGLGAELARLSSPNGKIQVSIQLPTPGSLDRPRWSASFHEKPILAECGLGLVTNEAGDLFTGARLVDRRTRSVDERVAV